MGQTFRAGDANQITREYLDSLLIELRYIDSVLPDTSLILYGEKFSTPVMTAAFSHLDKSHYDGMVEMAKGAYAVNACMWAGMGSDDELSRITDTGAKTIKIIKPHADNDDILHEMAHAEKCGCIALGMDVDHSFNRSGGYDIVDKLPMKGKSLDEIKGFVNATKLPFIIKGVLSVQDALKCVEAGIRGIVVSHHHGRIDFSVPPLMVLPEIVKAIDGRMPIFVDCSMDSGYDVFKALALGANAASVSRLIIESMRKDGADGVKKMLEDMTAQIAGLMVHTCSPDIGQIDSSVIRKR